MYSGQLRFGIWTPSANRLGKWHGPARPTGLMSWQPPHNVLTTLALAPSPLTLPEHWRADRKHHRNQTNSEIHKRTDRVTRDFWMDIHVNKQKFLLFSATYQTHTHTHAYTQACTNTQLWMVIWKREREMLAPQLGRIFNYRALVSEAHSFENVWACVSLAMSS